METDKAYYVGTHRYSFKSGDPAEIVGVKMVTPELEEQRLCYHIRWSDGCEDFVPVSDNTYKIIGFNDIVSGNIPDVTQ
jgi:hypothetical protein